MIKHSKHYFLYLIILASGFSTLSFSVRAENSNVDMYAASMSELSTLGVLLTKTTRDKPLPVNYPEQFDVIGAVNEINRAKGYIDVLAQHYPLSPAVRYFKLNSTLNSLNDIKPDTIVGLILDSKNRVSAIYEVPSSLFVPT